MNNFEEQVLINACHSLSHYTPKHGEKSACKRMCKTGLLIDETGPFDPPEGSFFVTKKGRDLADELMAAKEN